MREAPSLIIINKLLDLGASVRVFDPIAIEESKKLLGDRDGKIVYCQNQYEASKGADALLLITEWNEFRRISFETLKENMKSPVIFDGRNIYRAKTMRKEGFTYHGMGII